MATMFVGLSFALPVIILNKDSENNPTYAKVGIIVFLQVIEESDNISGRAMNVAVNVPVEASGSDVPPTITFEEIDLGKALILNIRHYKYAKLTPVQLHEIAIAMNSLITWRPDLMGDIGATGLHRHVLVHGNVDGPATGVVASLDNRDEDYNPSLWIHWALFSVIVHND
ncbi:hypothetical protein ACJRO7_026560 [Eucalyptus globulus]|uniref:Uncharacterized protein n=1 Tax=Eucalyptus globulus TaxID=34317 RepID=A0ABD3JT67_EUCGL